MALFRCGGGADKGITSATLVSTSSGYTATEDGVYAMYCYAGKSQNSKWKTTVTMSGGTALYSMSYGDHVEQSSGYWLSYGYGIRIAKLAKGETMLCSVGGSVTSSGSYWTWTVKLE